MREENPTENRPKPSRFSDQNQPPPAKNQTTKANPHPPSRLRSASAWGSHIVKGFTAEKKTKAAFAGKKPPPVASSDGNNQKNPNATSHSRVKRSLITDLSCTSQVHPQTHQRHSSGSRDLFNELDHLRGLLQESKEREFQLQAELAECKRNPKLLDIEAELEAKRSEVDDLARKVSVLEVEKRSLNEELVALISEKSEDNGVSVAVPSQGLEMEVLELRRVNKELQLHKRNLACKLASLESQLTSLAKASESEIVAKFKAEATTLRHMNEDLCKQVEGLQLNRLNEVEELAYLRWVNSCLRDELRNSCSTASSFMLSSPSSVERSGKSGGSMSSPRTNFLEYNSAKRLNFIKKLKKWPITSEDLPIMSNLESSDNLTDKSWVQSVETRSPRRRHSISGVKCSPEELMLNIRRQSDAFMNSKEVENVTEQLSLQNHDIGMTQSANLFGHCQETNKLASFEVEKRALRIPNPPPRPSCSTSSEPKEENSAQVPLPPAPPRPSCSISSVPIEENSAQVSLPLPPPPPPPPPPMFAVKGNTGRVQRAPQVVEFYHSLMKRDSRKDSSNGGTCDAADVANVRSNMIGEIENRSSHLLAIKADVETQGEFVNSLIREVNNAVYQNIEDVVEFVKWLDDELGFLVDERAVLKHFDWPEKKADTLRDAAFGYRDLKKLESEVTHYKDDPRMPCDLALKKMVALSDKMERTVYNLLRTRESLMRNCKEFQIPTDWILDNGIIAKIKFGSVKLAKKYVNRVAMELQFKAALEKDPAMDYMLLQGVRFAFRIHQFAGGFDAETMQAFEELRNLANLLNKK